MFADHIGVVDVWLKS